MIVYIYVHKCLKINQYDQVKAMDSSLNSDLLTSQINKLLAENQALKQQLKNTELAYEMAKEMGSFKAGFLARISHELRSPLNGLIGLHQLILSDLCENPQEEREFIEQAHERSLKLVKLIDEILMVSKIEHGTNQLNIQPVQLLKIFHEVYNSTYLLAANRNYPFNITFPSSEIKILADHRWMRQILINFIEMSITSDHESNINFSSSGIAENNCINSINICLDIAKDSLLISETIDLIKSENQISENVILSLGMKFLINQTLIEMMGGKLEMLASPIMENTKSELIRLQISMPLAL